jgi:hypothetical protein
MTNQEVLARIIDLMRSCYIKLDSPYDFENWLADNASHSQLFATGKFVTDSDVV